MTKKILSAILILTLCLSLCSCKGISGLVEEIQSVSEPIESEAEPTAEPTKAPEATKEPVKEEKPQVTVEPIEIKPYEVIEKEDGTVAVSYANIISEDMEIPETIDGKTVSEVADYAFESQYSIKSIKLPDTLTKIGEGAFSGCVRLETVELSSNLETIGKGAFLSCSALAEVSLPDSVIEIGDFAFAMCGRLTKAVLPEGLKDIPNRLFYACEMLSEVNLPKDLVTIGKRAFSRCKSLTAIELPDDIAYIGEYAFESCQSLTAIEFPCEVVEKGTFYGSFDLADVKFTNGVTTIGDLAFANTQVVFDKIPASVELIGEGVFKNDRMIKEIKVDEKSSNYVAKDGVLYTADMKTLVFYPSEKTDESYEVPKDVEKISPFAFTGAVNLKEVKLPETVRIIGADSFSYSGITSIEIPAAVVAIGDSAFEYCNSLESVKLNKGTELIGERTFAYCDGLKEIAFPDSIKVIKANAFVGSSEIVAAACEGNEEIRVSDSQVYNAISAELIYNFDRNGVGSITVVEGIKTISENAFADNVNLKEIIIPESVETIGQGAFPSGVYLIGNENSPARTYAYNNSLGYFAAAPNYADKEFTIAGGENAQFVVDNAFSGDIAYSSSDESIAVVDQSGNVTGIGIGFCEVYAVVGNCFFKANVTVSSDSNTKPEPEFDRSAYVSFKADGEDVEKWVEAYGRYNAAISVVPEDNPYTNMYKGEVVPYYIPMVAAQSGKPLSKQEQELFGDDFKDMSLMMDHGAEKELSRYHQTDDMKIYTGVYDYQITDAVGDIHNLVEINKNIGREFTLNTLVSTSIVEDAACSFGDCLFIIYGEKDVFDEVGCGYIDLFAKSTEKEILMSEGAMYQIIGCGILLNKNETFKQSSYKTYIELRLIGKEE